MQKRKKFLNCLFLALKLSTKLSHYYFWNILFIKLINLGLRIYQNQSYYKKYKNMCLQQTMPHKRLYVQIQERKTADGRAKDVQSKQQRHQNNVIDIVVVSSSPLPTIFHTPIQFPHFRP